MRLKDVMHMPSLRKNLISVGQLVDSCMKIFFTRDSWKITSGALIEDHSKKDSTLYIASGNIGTIATASKGVGAMYETDSSDTWVRRGYR